MGLVQVGTGKLELGGIARVLGKFSERLMGTPKGEIDLALDPGQWTEIEIGGVSGMGR